MTDAHALIAPAVDAILARLDGRRPDVAIVLGSGLGYLADKVDEAVRIPYREIPGFPEPTVQGHDGHLVLGRLNGREVVMQSGRFHPYEGHPPAVSALPVRVFAELGVRTFVVTNAAGGIRRTFRPGTLMLIADHINLQFRNPLTGHVLPGETRFPDMSDPYSADLRRLAHAVARERGIALDEGVYCGLLGPAYETQAEIRMLDRLGADAVGMSTVLEVIAARARGLQVLGISTITNYACGIGNQPLAHDEVMEVAKGVKDALGDLLTTLVPRLP